MKRITVKQLTLAGVMAALVFVTSMFLQIPISVGGSETRLHLGNGMCLLAGMLLGPYIGGAAAGIGSVIFDLINPAYIASAPFTFVFKFAMGFLCGLIVYGRKRPTLPRYAAGSTVGAFTYVLLYLSKSLVESRFVHDMDWQAILPVLGTKAATSVTNAVFAVLVATSLGLSLRPAVQRLFAEK